MKQIKKAEQSILDIEIDFDSDEPISTIALFGKPNCDECPVRYICNSDFISKSCE